MNRLFLLFYILLVTTLGQAKDLKKIVITESFKCSYLGKYSYLLEDSSHQASIEKLLLKPLSEWEESSLEKPRKGISSSMFWSRTTIENKTNKPQTMTIALEYSMVDWVQFFIVDDKQVIIDKSRAMGDIYTFKNRTVQHHYFIYNFVLPSNKSYTLYCKSGQKGGKFFLPLHLLKQNIWLSQNNKALLKHGLILGFVGILCFLSIVTFAYTTKVFLLFFSLQNLSLAFYYLSQNGLGFQYFWPDLILFQQIAILQSTNAFVIFKVLFLMLFFNTKEVKNIHNTFLFILGIQITCFILPITSIYSSIFRTPLIAKLFSFLNFSVTALLVFILLLLCFFLFRKTQNRYMRWYIYLLAFQIFILLILSLPYFTKIDLGNITLANTAVIQHES